MNCEGPTGSPRRLMVIGAFAAVYVIWGSTYLGIRYAVETLPPLLMGGSRFLLAGAIMYFAARQLGAPQPTAQQWRNAAFIGILLVTFANGGVTWVEQSVASSVVALMVTVTPLWIVLIEWARPGGRRPSVSAGLGLVLGFSGVAVIVMKGNSGWNGGIELSDLLVLFLASLAWATGTVWGRQLNRPGSAVLLVGMQMLAGGLAMTLVALALGEASHMDFARVSTRSVLAWCYLLVFGSLVGFTAYIWLLEVTTPDRVATHVFVNPVIAVILGVTLGKEALSSGMLMGAVLVVCSVVLILRKNKPGIIEAGSQTIDAPGEPLATRKTACS